MKIILFIITLVVSFSSFAQKNDPFKGAYICFDVNLIEADVEYDKVQWNSKNFIDVCELGLRVTATSPAYLYLTRNWRSPTYCKKFMAEWEELKKENRKICIAAYLSYPEKRKYKGKEILERSGFWEVIKSKNWCHTYFMGNCDGMPTSFRTESF